MHELLNVMYVDLNPYVSWDGYGNFQIEHISSLYFLPFNIINK